ncbi:MAG: hypothetical protein U1F43_14755 [Myxococcota bacterium]
MKLMLATTALLPLVFASTAMARPVRTPPPIRVPIEILSVVTSERDNGRVRAIVADQGAGPFLQVERLVPTRRGWLTKSVDRRDIFVLGDTVLDARSGRIDNLVVRRRVVSFDLDVGQRLTCRLRIDKDDRDDRDDWHDQWDDRVIRCGDRWDDDDAWHPMRPPPIQPVIPDRPIIPEHPTRPDRPVRPDYPVQPDRPPMHTEPLPQWAASPDVINTCGDVFMGSGSASCVDAVRNFHYNPVNAIRTCGQHLIGDMDALECLRRASSYFADPSPLIAACDDAMVGQSNILACIDAGRGARVDPVPTIRACAQSSIGDGNTLTCIQRAFQP